MPAFIITGEVKAALNAAAVKASRRPTPLSIIKKGRPSDIRNLSLADREAMIADGASSISSSEHVDIPVGFRAAINYEEQPAGICLHLSVSASKKGKVPSPRAVQMVLDALGLARSLEQCEAIWLEEYYPGHQSVNVLVCVAPTQGGHA